MAQKGKSYKSSPSSETIEQQIVIGVFRFIVWLLRLPFKAAVKRKTTDSRPAKRTSVGLDRPMIAKKWSEIQTMIGLGGASQFGQAVVAADRLLDHALKSKGYHGDTMGERLKMAANDLSPAVYDAAWQAHKLRNQLVHDVNGEVMSWQAKEAIGQYEQVLRELGGLS